MRPFPGGQHLRRFLVFGTAVVAAGGFLLVLFLPSVFQTDIRPWYPAAVDPTGIVQLFQTRNKTWNGESRASRASTERNIRRLDGIQGLYIRGNTAYQLVPALETRFLAFLPRGRWWRCRTDSYRTTPAPHLIEVTIQCPKKQQLFNNKKTTMCSKKWVEKRVQKEWSKRMVTKNGHKEWSKKRMVPHPHAHFQSPHHTLTVVGPGHQPRGFLFVDPRQRSDACPWTVAVWKPRQFFPRPE